MKIISKPRGGGKTTELIQEAGKGFYYIVCRNVKEAQRIANQAKSMKIDIPYPITYDELLQGRYFTKGVKGFAVDQIEDLVTHFTGNLVKVGTITENKEDPN